MTVTGQSSNVAAQAATSVQNLLFQRIVIREELGREMGGRQASHQWSRDFTLVHKGDNQGKLPSMASVLQQGLLYEGKIIDACNPGQERPSIYS